MEITKDLLGKKVMFEGIEETIVVIDYQSIVDTLNDKLSDSKWMRVELQQFYTSEKENVILIMLNDTGCDNEFRLYHNQLDDECRTTKDVMDRCKECVQEFLDEYTRDFKSLLAD